MTTKERIQVELNNLTEDEMNALLEVIRNMAQEKTEPEPRREGFLSQLKRIKIEAPEDFATNLDAYTGGEKQIGSPADIH